MATYFAQILTLLTLVCGVIWGLDRWVWRKRRQARLQQVEQQAQQPLDEQSRERILRLGGVKETCASVFPVLAVVLVLRSFLYEPFQIPSGSMMPTLLVGDFLLVEKFAYGLRDPLTSTKFLPTGEPKRGDIIVFKYPVDPSLDFIKRVVGLPGDRIIYRDKQLFIEPACHQQSPCPEQHKVPISDLHRSQFVANFMPLLEGQEQLGDVKHHILIDKSIPSREFAYYQQEDVATAQNEWIVPKGHYFAMGDNRDNSKDSRFWGFVPEQNLVGKAVCIWISFTFDRSADDWLPHWVPTGVRFNRVGSIH